MWKTSHENTEIHASVMQMCYEVLWNTYLQVSRIHFDVVLDL